MVYSLAESGSDIEDEAFWLMKLGFALQPDVVVAITGFNNLSNGTNPMWEKSSGGRAFQRTALLFKPQEGEGFEVTGRKFLAATYQLLTKKSRAMEWLDYWLFGDKAAKEIREGANRAAEEEQRIIKEHIALVAQQTKPDTLPTVAALRFTRAAIRTAALCQANQARYFVVLQPFKDCGPTFLQNLPADGSKDNRNQFLYRALRQQWDAQPQLMPYLDASQTIGNQLQQPENHFGDDCHLWDKGFEILNTATADWLKQQL